MVRSSGLAYMRIVFMRVIAAPTFLPATRCAAVWAFNWETVGDVKSHLNRLGYSYFDKLKEEGFKDVKSRSNRLGYSYFDKQKKEGQDGAVETMIYAYKIHRRITLMIKKINFKLIFYLDSCCIKIDWFSILFIHSKNVHNNIN